VRGYINKLNSRHANHFVSKHKSRKLSQGADALSRGHLLLFQLNSYVLGFKHPMSLYQGDSNFSELFEANMFDQREISYFKEVTISRE